MSGLVARGFETLRLPDLVEQLDTALLAAFGPELDTDVSVVSRLTGITADRLADVWELLEVLSWSRSPDGATGAQLDEVAALAGLTRGERSKVELVLRGGFGFTVPAGVEVTGPGAGTFALLAPVPMVSAVVGIWRVTFTTVAPNTYYGLVINGTAYGFTSGPGPQTAIGLAISLKAVIDSAGLSLQTNLSANNGVSLHDAWPGAAATITAGSPASVMGFVAQSGYIGFGVGDAVATQDGAIRAPAGALHTMVTPVAGIQAVTNPLAATVGTAGGTDTAFRQSWLDTVSYSESASFDAIRDGLLALDGVTAVSLLENCTNAVVNGRPPRTLEVIVEGGQDSEIARQLWDIRPAGIPLVSTLGTRVTMPVRDVMGGSHDLSFSRPADVLIAMKIAWQSHPEEEVPAAINALLTDAVLHQASLLKTGEDVIVSRLLAVAYLVPGIYQLAIKITRVSPQYWQDHIIEIGPAEIARLDISRIQIFHI